MHSKLHLPILSSRLLTRKTKNWYNEQFRFRRCSYRTAYQTRNDCDLTHSWNDDQNKNCGQGRLDVTKSEALIKRNCGPLDDEHQRLNLRAKTLSADLLYRWQDFRTVFFVSSYCVAEMSGFPWRMISIGFVAQISEWTTVENSNGLNGSSGRYTFVTPY